MIAVLRERPLSESSRYRHVHFGGVHAVRSHGLCTCKRSHGLCAGTVLCSNAEVERNRIMRMSRFGKDSLARGQTVTVHSEAAFWRAVPGLLFFHSCYNTSGIPESRLLYHTVLYMYRYAPYRINQSIHGVQSSESIASDGHHHGETKTHVVSFTFTTHF